MAISRKDQQGRRRDAAYARQREANERAAAAAVEAAARRHAAALVRDADADLLNKWGGANAALARLRDIGRQVEILHRAERELLVERDEAVAALRAAGTPWAVLADRSGLSRQALSKRAPG